MKLIGGRTLALNTLWNLVGQGVPLIVAVVSIPLLIKGLGIERFGVLTLAWMVIGYFSLFDFGIGRALTKVVAETLGSGKSEEVPTLVWTALFLMLLLGVAGSAVVASLTPWLVRDILKIPASLQRETIAAFLLLALSIPVVISTAGLRGVLEAYQRFGLVNAIRVPMGLFMFIGPLIVLPFSKSLFAVVGVLLVGRVIAWFAHFTLCLRVAKGLGERVTVNKELLGPLLRFGGWMTVTNVIGPLMVYLDRFMIGALLSIVSVAYYTTPFEIVTKLLVLPTALVAVLFPAFAAGFAYDQARTGVLFGRAVKYVFVSLYPIVLIIVALSREGLGLWLGPQFADHSTHVMQLLSVGVLFNSVAQIPFALVQGAGRPDLTAKLHLIELPIYLVAVWWLIRIYGIEGAAAAWLVRVTIDTVVLFAIARPFLPSSAEIGRFAPFTVGSLFLLLVSALLPNGILLKALFVASTLLAFLLMTWFRFLAPDERQLIHASVNRFGRPVFGRG